MLHLGHKAACLCQYHPDLLSLHISCAHALVMVSLDVLQGRAGLLDNVPTRSALLHQSLNIWA